MITCGCGYVGEPKIVPRTSGVHYADKRCDSCGRHLGFVPKPDSDPTKYSRPKSHQQLVEKFSNGFCELCLAKVEDLPKGQSMEAHHIIEFKDGGKSDRENIWIVCTGCHRLIHWRRTYSIIERVAEDLTAWMN